MKFFIISLLFVLISIAGMAQKKSIEFYDLLWNLAPDSTSGSPLISWNTTTRLNDFISWQVSAPSSQNNITKRGTLAVMINGKTFTCESKQTLCPVKLYFEGTQTGYSRFSLDHTLTKDFYPGKTLDYLFNKPVKYFLYQKNADNGGMQLNTYEIKMDGKRPVWLMYATIISPQGNGIYIKCYITEKALKADEIKKPVDPASEKLLPAAASLFKNGKTNLAMQRKMKFKNYCERKKGMKLLFTQRILTGMV